MVKGEGLRGHFYIFRSKQKLKCNISKSVQDYLGATVGRNQPANAGDTSSIPGSGRLHILWSN